MTPEHGRQRCQHGRSGTSYKYLLDTMATEQPAVWIGENNDELTELDSENRVYIKQSMRGIGYECEIGKGVADEHGSFIKVQTRIPCT